MVVSAQQQEEGLTCFCVYLQSRFFREPERNIAASAHGRQRLIPSHKAPFPLRVGPHLTAAPSSSKKHGCTAWYAGRCVAGVR